MESPLVVSKLDLLLLNAYDEGKKTSISFMKQK